MATLIRNRERMRQVRDFRGLRFGSISPTDIDGILDFGGKLWAIFELKHEDTPMPFGQRLALERLCDGLERGGTHAVVLVASHHEVTTDIDCATASVTRVRECGAWRNPLRPVTLRQAIDSLYARYVVTMALDAYGGAR